MKRIRNILLSLTILLVIVLSTACSSKQNTKNTVNTMTKVYVKEVRKGFNATVTYEYIESEDKIIKHISKTEGIYEYLPNMKNKEEAKNLLDPNGKKFDDIKGIKHSVEYLDDKFIDILEIDYTNLDIEKAKAKGVIEKEFEDPLKVPVSMKKTEKQMIEWGYTEQK